MIKYMEEIGRLTEIEGEIEDLISEAESLLPDIGGIKTRAQAYWITQIRGMLNSGYTKSTMHSIEDTIKELQEAEEDE